VTNKRFNLDHILLNRRVRILISSFVVLLLIWLAAGISDLSFAPGEPINVGEGEMRTIQETLGDVAREISKVPFGQQVLLLGIFFSVTAISLMLMPSELRKRLLRMLFRMAVTTFALLYLFNNFQLEDELGLPKELQFPSGSMESLKENGLAPEVFNVPPVSSTWIYVITLVLILLVLVVGWLLSRSWLKTKENYDGYQRSY
jgi:hypothetical protein